MAEGEEKKSSMIKRALDKYAVRSTGRFLVGLVLRARRAILQCAVNMKFGHKHPAMLCVFMKWHCSVCIPTKTAQRAQPSRLSGVCLDMQSALKLSWLRPNCRCYWTKKATPTIPKTCFSELRETHTFHFCFFIPKVLYLYVDYTGAVSKLFSSV